MPTAVKKREATSVVPMFIAAKCIDSQRSSGYNDTLSAINGGLKTQTMFRVSR